MKSRADRVILAFGDPLYRRKCRKMGYWWLTIYFARLALWYTIEDQHGKA